MNPDEHDGDDMTINLQPWRDYDDRWDFEHDPPELQQILMREQQRLSRLVQVATRRAIRKLYNPARMARIEATYQALKPVLADLTPDQLRQGVMYVHSVRPFELRFVPEEAWQRPDVQPSNVRQAIDRFHRSLEQRTANP